MGFKLIRLDSEESSKIPLNVGTHIIGRGSFLNCDDHRVSRRHGVIQVTESTVQLKSLHQNPCFYNKKELKKTALLPQGKCITLSNTDHFGLLPDTYWFEIIYCDNNNQHTNIPLKMDRDNRVDEIVNTQDPNRDTLNSEPNEETRPLSGYTNTGTQEVQYKSECDEGSDSDSLNLQFDESIEIENRDESQSLITGDNLVLCDPSSPPLDTTQNDQSKGDENDCNETPGKRPHEPDSYPAKKVKSEPRCPAVNEERNPSIEPSILETGPTSPVYEDTDSQNTNTTKQNAMDVTNTDNTNEQTKDSNTDAESNYDVDTDPPSPSNDVKDEPKSPSKVKKEPLSPKDEKKDSKTDKPGPSHNAGSSNDGVAAPNPPAPQPARERCIYGANCYRKNVQHKAQFSHPSDSDYGAGPRGLCPYGATCRRRDPRHWLVHTHPPGLQPPGPGPRLQPGNRAKKPRRVVRTTSSESENSDPDSPSPNLIVHGKRKRKPVKRVSWSDSEEEFKDPYGTDESDDWLPSSDAAMTSQSQGF